MVLNKYGPNSKGLFLSRTLYIVMIVCRYLLCGQDVTGELFQSTDPGRRMSTAGGTAVMSTVGSTASITTTGGSAVLTSAGSGPSSLETIITISPAAAKTIQVFFVM